MTALDLNRPPFVAEPVPMIIVDARAVNRDELRFCVQEGMARAQIAWVGFRHSAVRDPLTEAWQETAPRAATGTWTAFAEALFPGSRKMTADEAREIDNAILAKATQLRRSRR